MDYKIIFINITEEATLRIIWLIKTTIIINDKKMIIKKLEKKQERKIKITFITINKICKVTFIKIKV